MLVALNVVAIFVVACFYVFLLLLGFYNGAWQVNLDRSIINAAADGDQCFMGVNVTCLARVELLGQL